MKKAIASLGDVSAIPEAKVIGSWPVAVELSHLGIFQPFSHFITSLCEVTVHLSQIKAKNNVDDTTALHKAIHVQLADTIGKFKDHLFITKEQHNYMIWMVFKLKEYIICVLPDDTSVYEVWNTYIILIQTLVLYWLINVCSHFSQFNTFNTMLALICSWTRTTSWGLLPMHSK